MAEQKKILIVEDEELLSEFLQIHLKDDGYHIVGVASSGEDAIQLAMSTSPDLILMDIHLNTSLSGIDSAKAITSFVDVPVIFTSTEIEPSAIQSKPYGYLLKPINYAELRIAIQLAFDRYELENKLKSYQAHLNQAQRLGNMGSWEWNIINNDLIWSDHIFRIFGLEPQVFEPNYPAFLDRIYPDDKQSVMDAVTDAINNHKPYDIEHRVIHPNGNIRYVHEFGEVIYDHDNKPIHMMGTVLDITDRKETDKKIEHLAYYDVLTDLPNRRLLLDRLEVLIALSKRNKNKFAVLFIDLDGFKSVNDIYGHKLGDKLLQSIAERLQSVVRESDTIARIGGDEFIALIKETGSTDAITNVTEKILTVINQPYSFQDENTVNISASIGIATYPANGTNADDLLSNSDSAMYIAKHAGKNQFHFHVEESN